MINRIKNIVFTVLNKEKRGPITPDQLNNSFAKAQNKIFAGYFDTEIIRAKNRVARGMANDSVKLYEQRLSSFSDSAEVESSNGDFNLPSDCYFVDRRGITWKTSDGDYSDIDVLKPSVFRKEEESDVFAVCKISGDIISVKPTSIEKIYVDYYRKPKDPVWTYRDVDGVPYFDPTNASFQDFELHESEEPQIIMEVLSDFGVIKREADINQLMINEKQMSENGESRIL